MGEAEYYGFHFLREDKCLGYGDGRKVKKGSLLKVDCAPVLCQAALHASAKATDAVRYAPGPVVCWVRLKGDLVVGEDKAVARTRKVLAGPVDASRELRLHAVWCAARALKSAKVTDPRSWDALRVATRYAHGKATGEELAFAWDAAWDAARGAAARAAAWAAARDAEREAQERDLSRRLKKLMGV